MRRLGAFIVAWFSFSGLGMAMIQQSAVTRLLCVTLFLFGSVSFVALWRGASWGRIPLLVFGLAVVLCFVSLLTSIRPAAPASAWIALVIGGALFLTLVAILARRLNDPSPPAA